MPTLSQLRRRVDALERKYAKELAVVRLRRLADEFSHQWTNALYQRRPTPQPQPFIRLIAKSGYRLKTFVALDLYLERCSKEERVPDSLGIISSLLPKMPFDRLRKMLSWDIPEDHETGPYPWVRALLKHHSRLLLPGQGALGPSL